MLDTHEAQQSESIEPPTRRPGARRVAMLVPGAAMLVLGFWGLGRDGAMGNDEVATRWISSLPLHSMRHVLAHLDAVHGLYYLFIHFWRVLGSSPAMLRVPSVLAMAAALVVVAVLGRRLTSSTVAGVSAGLVAAGTPMIVFYAQTARSYALVYLVVALASLVLVRALDTEPESSSGRGWARWALYGALLVLAGYLNELSLLVLAAHLVTVLLARRGRRTLGSWAGVSAVAVVLVLPLIEVSRRQSAVLDYLKRPGSRDMLVLFHTFFGASTLIAVLVAALAVLGVVSRSSGAPRPVTVASVALPILVLPAAVLIGYSEVAASPLYANRYVLFGELGAALLAGAGIARLVDLVLPARPWLRTVSATLVCIALFAAQFGYQVDIRGPESRQFDFGGPAQVVAAQKRTGDAVLFMNSFFRRTRLGYPGDFRHVADIALARSPERTASFNGANKTWPEIRSSMLAHRRIWVIGRQPTHLGLTGPQVNREAGLLLGHYVQIGSWHFETTYVTLWQRG